MRHRTRLKRLAKSKEWFARITVSQAEKLRGLSGACWMLFTDLSFKNIDSRGKPFDLPDDISGDVGLSPRNLLRVLDQLEARGLISVRRQAPKPPLITIL
jgi:DNA-binding MarR family transcriptional regulator